MPKLWWQRGRLFAVREFLTCVRKQLSGSPCKFLNCLLLLNELVVMARLKVAAVPYDYSVPAEFLFLEVRKEHTSLKDVIDE